MADTNRTRNKSGRLKRFLKLFRIPVFFASKQVAPSIFLYGTLFVIGIVFFLVHFFNWALPTWNFNRDYEQVVCTIIDSRVAELRKDDAVLYRPEIQIEYEFSGTKYIIWTYEQATLSPNQPQGYDSDREAAETIAESHKPGQRVSCRVKIDEPFFAILYRPPQVWGWFFLLMMFLIAGSGFAGLWITIAKKRFSREHLVGKKSEGLPFLGAAKKRKPFPTIPDPASINDSPGTYLAYRLPTSQISVIRVIGSIVLCVFWNVIAWAVLFSVFLASADNPPSIMSRVFAILFFLLGLGMIVWVINLAVIAFGVGATLLELSDHPIVPGRSYRLHLMQLGGFRIRDYSVAIVCEEVARFRQGTDTVTTRREVFRKELFRKKDFETQRDTPLVRDMRFLLPYGVMHSFVTEHNEICWKIVVGADIVNWPDVKRECPIIVRPPQIVASPYLAEYDDYDLYPR